MPEMSPSPWWQAQSAMHSRSVRFSCWCRSSLLLRLSQCCPHRRYLGTEAVVPGRVRHPAHSGGALHSLRQQLLANRRPAGEIDIHKDEVVGLQHREDQALNLSPASRRSEPTPCLCVLIIGVRKTRGAFDMDDVNERRGFSDWLRSAFRLSGVEGWSLCFQAISGDVP
jgi:hypothetical protein